MSAQPYSSGTNSTFFIDTTNITATTISTYQSAHQPIPRGIPESTRKLAFEDFHAEHPEVYESIRSLALVTADGPVSVRRLIERLRLGSNLKINNNHIRFYAKKLKEDYPHQAHLFKTRGPR